MSLVGPRPEQPEFVDRLEQILPFYQRRHLMRPGITGWAQVRCGYAGSDVGSAWKLCHDLYYAKHRSAGVDLLILGETLATLAFKREPVMRPENVAFVLADER
jgi:lipopolysaccharide/colanic/teichoic acid biosynthesis glycosyltransferase